MCIICVKKSGVKTPNKKTVETMCNANPDGFGVVTYENGRLILRKTMNKNEYVKWVTAIPKAVPAIMHMRIATHGSVCKNNCHPFMTNDSRYAFAHNGVLSIKNEGDWTDSETFLHRIAEPMLNAGVKPSDAAFRLMVNTIIGSSKFAFLSDKGELVTYGNFVEDGGLMYSNTTYKSRYSLWDDKHFKDYSFGKVSKAVINNCIAQLKSEFNYLGVPSKKDYLDWFYSGYQYDMSVSKFKEIFDNTIDQYCSIDEYETACNI